MNYPLLLLLVCLPLIGVLFVLSAKNTDITERNFNVLNVGSLTVAADIVLILHIFENMNISSKFLQLVEEYVWIENPELKIVLGADVFSMIIILAVNLAFLIGFIGISQKQKDMRYIMVFSLTALSMINGFFVAADMFSFYIFFQAMLLPIFMLIGMFGGIRKETSLFRFLTYNLLGSMFLFISTMLIYSLENENISLNNIQRLHFEGWLAFVVWGGILVSFLSRIPIWPFHYFISSVHSNLKNPLVFIVVGLMPLTGIYGFVRFWPNVIPFISSQYIYLMEIIGVVTMLFIAVIGMVNRDMQYKLFAYMTIYYLFYLQGIFLPTSSLMSNISYSLFSYLLIVAVLSVVNSYVERRADGGDESSVLCKMPKLLMIASFMILAAIGLPLSSLFMNNFIMLAEIFNHNLYIGLAVVLSMFFVSASLLMEFYRLKGENNVNSDCVEDISNLRFLGMAAVAVLLCMSFIKPLWFVL